jgi:hypothetical protein
VQGAPGGGELNGEMAEAADAEDPDGTGGIYMQETQAGYCPSKRRSSRYRFPISN